MPIIKVELRLAEIGEALEAFKANRRKALENFTNDVREFVSEAFNELMKAEIDVFLGLADQQDNKKNGYHPEREYALRGVGGIRVRVPKDRKGQFSSAVIPTYERIDPRIKADMAILHLAGLSTRTLALISRRLLGVEVTKDTISDSLSLISEEALNWLTRPITKKYWALYVDGTFFRVQRRGSTKSEPSLVVVGIDSDNYRSILAIEPGTKDNTDAWRAVFAELRRRGLSSSDVRIGVMDGLPGLEKLFREEFPNAVTARCWSHAKRNAVAKCPERLRSAFEVAVNKVMYATSENASRKAFDALCQEMKSDAERAVLCLQKDLDSLTAHYRFDKECWVALRTTNAIENINRQLKRRTQTMDTVGESTLQSMLAFVALKIEIGWQMHRVNSKIFNKTKKGEANVLDQVVDEMNLLN